MVRVFDCHSEKEKKDAWLSGNKRGKSVLRVSFPTASFWFNSIATWLEWSTVAQDFWVRILADQRGSSVVRHLPLVLEVPGSIPARGEKNFGVRTRFL